MSSRLLLSGQPGETRAAWLEDGRLSDLFIQRDDRPELVGSLYRARVVRYLPFHLFKRVRAYLSKKFKLIKVSYS